MLRSAFWAIGSVSWLSVIPIEGSFEKRRIQILRPRRRLLIWSFLSFVFVPIKLAVTFFNLYREFAKEQDDPDSFKKAYVLNLVFIATFLTMGLALNVHTVFKFHAMLEGMNQSLILDDWLQSKLIRFFFCFYPFSELHLKI